jgi:hypothetical protein
MKIIALLALVALSTGTALAQSKPKDFLGYYEGVQVGNNRSTVTGPSMDSTSQSFYPSIVLGYNMMYSNMLVGIEGFADYQKKSSTGIVAGVTFKAGKIINHTLVYARAGVKGDSPSYRPQVGLSGMVSTNGIVNRFAYDKLNRLRSIKDHNSYLTDLYNYVYATTAPTGCTTPDAPSISNSPITLLTFISILFVLHFNIYSG